MPAAGVIVFNHDMTRVVIVKQDKNEDGSYNVGFPKGGQQRRETVLNTALRECQEEGGLTRTTDYTLLGHPLHQVIDLKPNGNISVVYFVAVAHKERDDYKFTWDSKEAEFIGWLPLAEAASALPKRRAEVLERALKLARAAAPAEGASSTAKEQAPSTLLQALAKKQGTAEKKA